jgi:2-oxoglutarate dehydrogenase complex dehydrogenase (E1) component-like enzyme
MNLFFIQVACGKARARQMSRGTGDYSQTLDKLMGDDVLCVAVHGDAAFAGQVRRTISNQQYVKLK